MLMYAFYKYAYDIWGPSSDSYTTRQDDLKQTNSIV